MTLKEEEERTLKREDGGGPSRASDQVLSDEKMVINCPWEGTYVKFKG